MPEWLSVIFLGIVEGITEFLPISSTGHLLLVEQVVPRRSELFNVVIQAAAVLAVLPLFPQRLRQLVHCIREPAARDYFYKLAAAFFLTGMGGWMLKKMHISLPETAMPVAIALMVGGILFLVVEWRLKGSFVHNNVTWSMAVMVGLGQLVAMAFPGASRSGATILLCLIMGLSRPAATEFSFLVSIPTMLAASGYEILHELRHPALGMQQENWGMVLLGCVISAAVSWMAVRWLLRYVQTHTFVIFGWYRIILGGVIIGFALLKGLS